MEITALIVLCIITALLALSLRGQRPEFAMLLSLGCGLFVLLYLLGQMKDIFSGLEDILSGLSGQSELTAIILKALLWRNWAASAAEMPEKQRLLPRWSWPPKQH